MPTIQSSLTSSNDNHTRIYNQLASNQNFISYLRSYYSHWLTTIQPDGYVVIPSTPLLIAKRPDNVMLLVAPDGQSGYVYLDLASLVAQLPVTTWPAPSQGNPQEQTTRSSVAHSTTSEATSSQIFVPASAVPQSQIRTSEPHSSTLQASSAPTSVRAPATPQSQLSVMNEPRSSALQASSAPTSVAASVVPQSQMRTSEPHSSTLNASSAHTSVRASATPQSQLSVMNKPRSTATGAGSAQKPKIRTPADADKRHLARDILRALGIKRRHPSGTQATERAAKRHQPDPAVRVVSASGAQETRSTQLVFRAVTVEEIRGAQPDQPVIPAPSTVNEVQSTREPAVSVDGALLVQHVSNVVSSTSVPENAQPNHAAMSVAPPNEPKAAHTSVIHTPPTSPPIRSSVALGTNDETVTIPSALIDVPSPSIKSPKLGPVIEDVAADSAERPSPEEPTIAEVHGSTMLLSATPSVPYLVESPAAKTIDLQKKSDDATSDFDRLTIQDEIVSPGAANHLDISLEIEELEDDVVMQDIREASHEEGEVVTLQDVRGMSQEEGELVVLQNVRGASPDGGRSDELEASAEEGEISMEVDELEASQEEGEISAQVDELEASKEEREMSVQVDELETSQEEGEISIQQEGVMSPRIKAVGDAEGLPPVLPATPMPQANQGNKQTSRTPLFLPSPSASPLTVESPTFSRKIPPPVANYVDEDIVDRPEATEMITQKRSLYRRAKRKDQPFYILVPPPPPYLVKLKKEEARQRRKRNTYFRSKWYEQQSDGRP